MLIGNFVEVAPGTSDQSVVAELPNFEPADTNQLPGSAWPGVGAGERLMINGVALKYEIIHFQSQIRKCGHESLSHIADGRPACRSGGSVDLQ
jgi:hypothetical protein